MKVGILGSGAVGQTLALGFLKKNYQTMIGTQHQEKLKDWLGKNKGVKVGSFEDTAAFADIIVLAVKGTAAKEALKMAGAENLWKKTVVDTTNPIAAAPPVNGVLKFFTSLDASLMERLQQAYPGVRFVKAFNSVGNAKMVNPQYASGRPTMFICGNDTAAKQVVSGVLDQFGWETLDLGAVEAARAIEPLCILWCIPGFLHNEWTHAFKVLHA